MTAPTRFRGSVRTTNETSFAVAYGDATALILDGLPHIGGIRAEKFFFARLRAEDSLKYTDNPEEQALARQLLAYIAIAEQRKWNY